MTRGIQKYMIFLAKPVSCEVIMMEIFGKYLFPVNQRNLT